MTNLQIWNPQKEDTVLVSSFLKNTFNNSLCVQKEGEFGAFKPNIKGKKPLLFFHTPMSSNNVPKLLLYWTSSRNFPNGRVVAEK